MADAWEVLGFDYIASRVADGLDDGDDVIVIQGPPGAGKSWLARGIGVMWESGKGSAVVAEGDFLRGETALYPFGFAMSGLQSGWKNLLPLLKGVTKAGETLVGTAGIITATVEAASKLRRTRESARTMSLPNNQQDILHELEGFSEQRPLLFIADNLHWWDAESLEFLGRLRDPRMWSAFPFLAELRVLAVQTAEPYQSVVNPRARDAFLAPSTTRYFELKRVPRKGFENVLEALGAGPEPSAAVTHAVYAFSGGHLALASRCAARIANGDGNALIAAADSDDFLRRLLVERIRSLGAKGQQAVAMLQTAAVLGLTFRRDELTCTLGGADAETARLLRYCRDEDVLELSDGVGRFVHDLYRQHFLAVGALDTTSIHETLASCLRILRPGEYELRCLNAVKAEREGEAAALGVQAALQRQREGQPWMELPPVVVFAVERGGLTPVVERFAAALDHLNQYRYADCLDVMVGLPHGLPKRLLAEADYLRATCMIATRSGVDRSNGVSLLESWEEYEAEESELGVRLMQLRLYGLTLDADKGPGRVLEGQIKRALRARVSFDPAAEDASYTLDRCSGSLYEPDVVLIRNREAARHFSPAEGQTLVRRPVEYYRCLVNLGSSLLANARYQEACEVSEEIERLVSRYAAGVFPRLDYPSTNGLLAQYRMGVVDADAAVQRQGEIAAQHEVPGDPFYVENALAVYLTLAGSHGEATEIYDRLLGNLMHRQDPEANMLYLIRANHCAARFVAGAVDGLDAEWGALSDVVTQIPYAIGRFLVRRHELLAEVIREGEAMSPRAFDECLVVGRPAEFGPLWDQLGRGFRMPEIEWWR